MANPFNPETRPRHHLESVRISRESRNSGAESRFNQPRGVKTIQPAEPRVVMGQMAGQGAQIAIGRNDFAETGNFAGLDRRASHVRIGRQQGGYRSRPMTW